MLWYPDATNSSESVVQYAINSCDDNNLLFTAGTVPTELQLHSISYISCILI